MSDKGHILLVEDDLNLGFVIKDNLEVNGYTVTLATDGVAAAQTFSSGTFDLCILDIMLPRQDGITLAGKIREQSESIPIIFLSAKSMKEDKVAGFRAGADDYMTKPFSVEELLLRIEAILKRTRVTRQPDQPQYSIGHFSFDYANRTLAGPDGSRSLTQKEADVLKLLMQHQDQTLTRQQILLSIWGNDDYFVGRSLDVFISKLRKYLAPDPRIEIVNLHGTGFRLALKPEVKVK